MCLQTGLYSFFGKTCRPHCLMGLDKAQQGHIGDANTVW